MEAHPKSVLYRLLYMGFVDIREATRENFPIKALRISECLSELPLQLDCLLNSQESSASILNHLKSRLRNQRLGLWLENILEHIDRHYNATEIAKRNSFSHLPSIDDSQEQKLKNTLHRLLTIAFTEIKNDSATIFSNKVFYISDLVHNVPLQLDRASRGELQYREILEELKVRALDRVYVEWLTSAFAQIEHDRLSAAGTDC